MNYLMPEVRGGGLEEPPHNQGQGRQPRGATPHPRSGEAGRTIPRLRSGVAAETNNLTPEVRGSGLEELPHFRGQGRQDELPRARGQGWRLRQITPRRRSGALAERSYHTPEVRAVA